MSDIYLSLTETPSVVTLSQPVVSGALASTVTVANTVTVALDANSLSALENVTVTVGSSVALAAGSAQIGSVTASISNFPATQTIAGTVTANGLALGQEIVNVFPIGIGQIGGGGVRAVADLPNYYVPVAVREGTVTANLGGYSQTAVSYANSSVTAIPVALQTNGVYGGTLLAYNGANTYLRVGLDAVGPNSLAFGGSVPISGTVTANGGDFVGSEDAGAINRGVQLGFYDNEADSFRMANTNTPLPVTDSTLFSVAQFNNDGIPQKGIQIGWADTNEGSFFQVSDVKPLPISGTVTIGAVSTSVTVSQIQGTSVTTSNFTSTTASTTLVSANSARRGLTVFNEGAGNLHICAGATATTLAYQVRLSAGDYWECPSVQTSLTHSAQFASAGTARVVEII